MIRKKPVNKAATDQNAIPCMVLTFTDDELSFIRMVLEAEGYEDDLKQWILDTMQGENIDEEDGDRYAGAADRVIQNVSEFVRDNPDTIRAASSLANSLVGNLLRKVSGKQKGPQ
jgi:hypothetical protein